MSAPAFTPGPWAVHPFAAAVYVVPSDQTKRPIGGAEDAAYDLAHFAQEICLLHHPDRHRGEVMVRANARLIAAAPEMYAVAAKFVEHCTFDTLGKGNNLDNLFAEAKAALAKARGEQ